MSKSWKCRLGIHGKTRKEDWGFSWNYVCIDCGDIVFSVGVH